MKKFIISIMTTLLIIALSYIFKDITINKSIANNNRFEKVLDQGNFEIYCDKETRVMYLQSNAGCGYQGYGGLTVMVDEDGKPLLYK